MIDIMIFLKSLSEFLTKSQLKNLTEIILAMLCMSGNKTMLNISRWTKVSYKTVQRLYNESIPWIDIRLRLFIKFSFNNQFLTGNIDETIVTKSGKKTHGLDNFFSSLYQKVTKGLCFSCLSIIAPDTLDSFPLLVNKLVFTPEEKEEQKAKKEAKKKGKNKVGRPKGSKNGKTKTLAPTFRLVKEQLAESSEILKYKLNIKHLVGDGFYGNKTFIAICEYFGFYLISKAQYNANLYFCYQGTYSGHGRPCIYGKKIDLENLKDKYLIREFEEKGTLIKEYQIECMHKTFQRKINAVIIVKENRKTKKYSRAILFSTDLSLSADEIMRYYSARFQIEFNFRDAKEFWGLEDFMNVKDKPIENAVNFSFFMVGFSKIILRHFRKKENNSFLGIRDLISAYRADKYISETLKLVRKFHPDILIPDVFDKSSVLGRIHV